MSLVSSVRKTLTPERSHINVFIQFAKAVGLNEADLKNSYPRDYTREILNKIENLLVHAPFMEAMGCMSPGLENALAIIVTTFIKDYKINTDLLKNHFIILNYIRF